MAEDRPRDHRKGHRDRLRKRFLEGGSDALPDYELLELLLFLAIPRHDVKEPAKALIQRFGSFAGVVGAEPARLREVEGVGESVATAVKIVVAAMHRALCDRAMDRPSVASWDAVIDYCKARLQDSGQEQFRVLFLDARNNVIADEELQKGTVDHAPVYPREVVRRALAHDACSIILVHNHPSGDPTPSRADVATTRKVIEAASAVGVDVHDHIVVGRSGHSSMKSLRLI